MNAMDFLKEFLHQKVPKSSEQMPEYYRKALLISEAILAFYYLSNCVLLFLTQGEWKLFPVVVCVFVFLCLFNIEKMGPRTNLFCISMLIGLWLTWFVHMFGWAAGSPNILVPILSLTFFNIYVPPIWKIVCFLGLSAFRVSLFTYSLLHGAVGSLDHLANLCFQIINSIVPLLILTVNYILFSSSIQANERKLTIDNLELHMEASTDALTGLPNRRAMLYTIDRYQQANPNSSYCLAIADIDLFKRINDTYGHQCGDYTLKELANLFKSFTGTQYAVCRWGGEEFCFFMPNLNLDQAGTAMQELKEKTKNMPLHYGTVDFSITITIGVEEYDYHSTVEEVFERADKKLYIGKMQGRNIVVV